MKNKIHVGNCLKVMKKFKAKSINCVVTSPPFWGLRDYGTIPQIYGGDSNCEHEWIPYIKKGIKGGKKSKKVKVKGAENFQDVKDVTNWYCECGAIKCELGREPKFEMFISDLCDIFDEVKRVLTSDGSCWVNLGDTYWGGGNAQGHTAETTNFGRKTLKRGYNTKPIARGKGYKNKCLVMIPERFALEMINRGWILRQKIIWYKPNGMPHPVKDRSTMNYEFFYHFVKNKKYYYKQQFDPLKHPDAKGMKFGGNKAEGYNNPTYSGNVYDASTLVLGKNKRAVWNIMTSNSKDSHFAVYPRELVRIPIDATCPKEICNKCNKPREMEVIKTEEGESTYEGKTVKYTDEMLLKEYIKWMILYKMDLDEEGSVEDYLKNFTDEDLLFEANAYLKITNHPFVHFLEKKTGSQDPSNLKRRIQESMSAKYSIEWTDCGCDEGFHAGVVLDPFLGSGTTSIEALSQGKNFVGIEVNKEFAQLALKNIKAFKSQRRVFY